MSRIEEIGLEETTDGSDSLTRAYLPDSTGAEAPARFTRDAAVSGRRRPTSS